MRALAAATAQLVKQSCPFANLRCKSAVQNRVVGRAWRWSLDPAPTRCGCSSQKALQSIFNVKQHPYSPSTFAVFAKHVATVMNALRHIEFGHHPIGSCPRESRSVGESTFHG